MNLNSGREDRGISPSLSSNRKTANRQNPVLRFCEILPAL
jgi:hypothetical protein